MKHLPITELAGRLGTSRTEAYSLLADIGIIGSPTQHYLTEKGKQYAQEKYIENDRYGRSYWLQTFNSELIDMIKKRTK